MQSKTKETQAPVPRHPWHVERVAVDEPEEGESGTIYEYQVRESHRIVCTVHYKDDAESIVLDHNTAPDLLAALVAAAPYFAPTHPNPRYDAHGKVGPMVRASILRATEGR
jgi:hypothetical protein